MYRRHTPRLYQMLWVVFVLLVTLNVVLFTGHQVGAFCDLDSSPFSNTFPEVPRALVEKRKQLQSQMKEESPSCDFPIHYDMYRALHFYEENNFVKESDIPSRKSYFDYWYKNSQARHGEGLRKERDEKLSKRERSISFLAIGKAGGSSLTCNLRAALPFAYHCPTYDAQNQTVKAFWGTNESALSKQVTCYNHCDTNLFCYDNPSFLLNLRNPISRIKSWYHYEHPVNMKNSMYSSCGRRMLFTCYSTFDELATYGLEGPRPAKTHTLRIGADLTENECRHWAWATVEGSMPATWHNFFNYNWYFEAGVDLRTREIFVLRTEHFEHDWKILDAMLGGKGTAPEHLHVNKSEKNQMYVNNTVSARGVHNLCRALCKEISTYTEILKNAVNLGANDLHETLTTLRAQCPDQVDQGMKLCEQI